IVGVGWHQVPGQAHAEIIALAQAGEQARGSTVYVTLEPCSHHGKTPPCSDALIKAGVKNVIIAAVDPNPKVSGSGVQQLEQAGIKVFHLQDFDQRARAINRGYFKRFNFGKPFVRCKLAMSLDGRTAAAGGESKWITGPEARSDVQRLRAESCAIVTGINTVLQDDPSLTLRAAELQLNETEIEHNAFALGRQPLRVVLDSSLRTPSAARLLFAPGKVLLYSANSKSVHFPANVAVINVAPGRTGVNPGAVLESLASQYQVNEVLLEAGPTVCGAWLAEGLVDELVIYIGASLLGQHGLPLMYLPVINSMDEKLPLEIIDLKKTGMDIRITARPGKA
ncbi:MAG: bifunctional diaminohydroxyphosphoribosylaminopyrimidine deaminase/5-amino-6-(5-phosphoribosylamino)uracil reductase RibD, partial [Pseudohongiellaceae bacterium]